MLSANVKLIEQMQGFVQYVASNRSRIEQFTASDRDFTRRRKLDFTHLVLVILQLCKKTLSVELEHFFEQSGTPLPCTVSAFVQQRLKLSAAFFYCWNIVLWMNFYRLYAPHIRRWRGYRVVAMDGSTVSLTNTALLQQYFGGQSNQHMPYCAAGTFYCYDVLNDVVLYSEIAPYRTGELRLAYRMIERLEPDMVALYDRNFSNYKVVALHQWQEREVKYVIRAKRNFTQVKAFLSSGLASLQTELYPGTDAIKGLRKSGYIITGKTAVAVRLVRVELQGTTEVLLTNLWEEEGYDAEGFRELYGLRWGVETSIGFQKNVLQLECFSGLTPGAVMQDFYATVLMANLHSILSKDAQAVVEQKAGKHPLKINKNKTSAKLKELLVPLFLRHHPRTILKRLHDYFQKDPLPVRKGRQFERKRKNVQSRTKFKTYTNYKPAF